jgi:hypothetical protein
VPAQVAQLLAQISHDVFVNAYLEAMKSTLYLPVAVVLLAAVVTVLLRRQAQCLGQRGERPAQPRTRRAPRAGVGKALTRVLRLGCRE